MISIIIPVLNEEEALPHLYEEVMKIAPTLDGEYEFIFIDDGSIDTSLQILKKLAEKNKRVHVFSFRRNLGKAEALTYGFIKAKGELIVTLDADLQDKPSEIWKLLEKHKKGAEVVCGWRKNQKRKSSMIFISWIFNNIVGWLFDLRLHDYNCGLKLYTNEAAKSLRLYGGLHRFIPLLAYEQGFSVDEVEVEHAARKYGKSKYGFSKLWKDLPDMFTMLFLVKYGKRPLHFFGLMGGICLIIGLIMLLYLSFIHEFYHVTIGRRPLLLFGALFVLAGFQIFFTGFLADLMINIAHTPRLLDEEKAHFPLKYSSDK